MQFGSARAAVLRGVGCALAVTAVACTTVRPPSLGGGPVVIRSPFSHVGFEPVLQDFVDDQGRVDYVRLRADHQALDRYYYQVSRCSPDSTPEFFPTEADRLAYWINAYNAAVLSAVISRYPIDSVLDVKPPFPFFFLPRESGFFVFERVVMGDRSTSLWCVENRVIRKRFKDPRVHFALNCASRGCPRLPRVPFRPAQLDEQLDRATREFIAEERNVRIDDAARVVYLSSIFDWYRSDFLDWLTSNGAGSNPTLLDYVARYAGPEQAVALDRAAGYETRFVPYDWSLNAQDTPATGEGEAPGGAEDAAQ